MPYLFENHRLDPDLRELARDRHWGFVSKQARTAALRSLMTHLYQRGS